jgi:hypothetical protein
MEKMEVREIMMSISVIPKIEAGNLRAIRILHSVKKALRRAPLHLPFQRVTLTAYNLTS